MDMDIWCCELTRAFWLLLVVVFLFVFLSFVGAGAYFLVEVYLARLAVHCSWQLWHALLGKHQKSRENIEELSLSDCICMYLLCSDSSMYMIKSTAACWRMRLICVGLPTGLNTQNQTTDQPQVLCSWTWKGKNLNQFDQEWKEKCLEGLGAQPMIATLRKVPHASIHQIFSIIPILWVYAGRQCFNSTPAWIQSFLQFLAFISPSISTDPIARWFFSSPCIIMSSAFAPPKPPSAFSFVPRSLHRLPSWPSVMAAINWWPTALLHLAAANAPSFCRAKAQQKQAAAFWSLSEEVGLIVLVLFEGFKMSMLKQYLEGAPFWAYAGKPCAICVPREREPAAHWRVRGTARRQLAPTGHFWRIDVLFIGRG